MFRLLFVIISFFVFASPHAIQATSPALKACLIQHGDCIQSCLSLETEGAQAACVTKCAGAQASCAGQVGLGSSKPFLDEKIEQLDGLLNEFLNDLLPVPQKNQPDEKAISEQNT